MLRPADLIRRILVPTMALAMSACIIASAADAGAVRTAQAGAPHMTARQAAAFEAGDFDPGEIISDENFYDSSSMTAADVQGFLHSQRCVPADDSPCLADYRVDAAAQPTQFAHCARYPGGRDLPASTIIVGIAHACGISPKVLLVLLQKEQSLITHPSAYGYQRATGYGCPDTADCDAHYFGFVNQLYNAAWQFREYGASPGWRYHVGEVRVQYSPDRSCGSSVVSIRNQATANLYNYTPYQPDAATVRHPDGPASRCSTFGNLNFSLIYQKWFGSPTTDRLPAWWGECLRYPAGGDCSSADPAAP